MRVGYWWGAVAMLSCGTGTGPSTVSAKQAVTVAAAPVHALVAFDQSGSMLQVVDTQTRLQLTQALTTQLLDASPGVSFALGLSPDDPLCGAPSSLAVGFSADDAATRASTIATIEQRLGAVSPSGGTPTAAVLQYAASLPELNDATAERVVVLVTDGVPNCNPVAQQGACDCGLTVCSGATQYIGCVDNDGLGAASAQLQAAGIELVTIAVGDEWTGAEALPVLQKLSAAGASATVCAGECASNTARLSSAADVAAVRAQVSARLLALQRCSFELGASDEGVVVSLDGAVLEASHFTRTGTHVRLDPASCTKVLAGSALTRSPRKTNAPSSTTCTTVLGTMPESRVMVPSRQASTSMGASIAWCAAFPRKNTRSVGESAWRRMARLMPPPANSATPTSRTQTTTAAVASTPLLARSTSGKAVAKVPTVRAIQPAKLMKWVRFMRAMVRARSRAANSLGGKCGAPALESEARHVSHLPGDAEVLAREAWPLPARPGV